MTSHAKLTPSQTIGPFYWGTLVNAYRCDLAPPGVAGERIEFALSLRAVRVHRPADRRRPSPRWGERHAIDPGSLRLRTVHPPGRHSERPLSR